MGYDNRFGDYLSLGGGTITGDLTITGTLTADSTTADHATTADSATTATTAATATNALKVTGPSVTGASAPILNTLGATNGGAAVQLADLTRDYMVYLQVGTAGTAFGLGIGATSAATDLAILTSAVATAGELITFRLPAGWYFKWSATTATLAVQNAVGC